MNALWALAWNGFREARRNRITVVVAAFAAAVLLSTSLVTSVTVNTFERVLNDFCLGSMSLILVFLAIFLSSGLLAREIERRTIFLMVSKPVSRARFLVARLAGNLITLGALLVGMTLVFWAEMALYHLPITLTQAEAVLGLWFELWVLSALGFVFSSFAGQTVSALATTGIYLAGHLSADIYTLAQASKHPAIKTFGTVVYYVLPNLERVNFRSLASAGLSVPPGQLASGIVYAAGYTVALCILAITIFDRRDFR